MSRLASLSSHVFVLGLLAASTACVETTAPVAPLGVYALQAYATHALPVLMSESPEHRVTLLADTLQLGPGGVGVRIQWQRQEQLAGSALSSTVRLERPLRIVVRGGQLRAEEEVICALAHVIESCADLWNAPVSVTETTLTVGPRRYARLAAAP